MPHKNLRCKGSDENPHWTKMKHHRWLRQHEIFRDKFHRGEYWHRELICPTCGTIKNDVKMRKASTMRRIQDKQTKRT